jgi:hypothetical protein
MSMNGGGLNLRRYESGSSLRQPGADPLAFLAGGGEMGAIIRNHDWTGSSLSAPETWPQPLRTAVRFMLNTGHPMYIWWGAEGACLYNDAYRASSRTTPWFARPAGAGGLGGDLGHYWSPDRTGYGGRPGNLA